jgi:hypothetical protein
MEEITKKYLTLVGLLLMTAYGIAIWLVFETRPGHRLFSLGFSRGFPQYLKLWHDHSIPIHYSLTSLS